jgi:ribonuclease BN (tRNA processing enzyme)
MLELVVTGTGTPLLSERAGPSALVVHHSAGEEHPSLYLVDAGRWVTQRLAQAQVPWLDIEAVLFTHHHMDHDIGWPDLFMTGYNMGRREKWQVYGPPPTAAFCETQEQAFEYDRAIRLIPSFQTEGFWSTVTELETGGPVLEHKGMAISACEVDHGWCKPAFAYKFESADGTIVISGDTAPSDALVDFAQGANVLLHEVLHWPAIRSAPRVGDFQEADLQALAAHHTSSEDVGAIAQRAHVKTLVLTHFIPPFFDPVELREYVAKDFDGEIVIADDLTRVELPEVDSMFEARERA